MSSDSQQERERLKEEYKAHYQKMRDTRARLKKSQKKRDIVQALKNMDSSELMESFDDFLFAVKSKVAHAEARLDIALDNLDENDPDRTAEYEDQHHRTKAKETLQQIKNEMGLLYSELSQKADAIDVEKTVGSASEAPARDQSASNIT